MRRLIIILVLCLTVQLLGNGMACEFNVLDRPKFGIINHLDTGCLGFKVVVAELGSPEVQVWNFRNRKSPTIKTLEYSEIIIDQLKKRGVVDEYATFERFVAISSDEEIIATGALGNVNLWRNKLETPYALTPFRYSEDTRMHMKFSSDTKWFVMGGAADTYLTLWNLHSIGDPKHVFRINRMHGKTFDINKNNLLVGENGDEILSLDLTGTEPSRLTGYPISDEIVKLVIDSYNRFIVFSTPDNGIKAIDITSPSKTPVKIGSHKTTISALSISPCGRWLVSGTAMGGIGIWELAPRDNLPRIHSLINPGIGAINDIAFHPQENVFATAGYGSTAGLWRIVNGPDARLLRTFKGHQASFRSVIFTDKGRKLMASGWYSLQVWDVEHCIHPDPGVKDRNNAPSARQTGK